MIIEQALLCDAMTPRPDLIVWCQLHASKDVLCSFCEGVNCIWMCHWVALLGTELAEDAQQ